MMMKRKAANNTVTNVVRTQSSIEKTRLEFAAAHSAPEVLEKLGSSAAGLTAAAVENSRRENGANQMARSKKKTLAKRLAEAFINPFAIVLFCLAAVSVVTDIVFPIYSLFGRTPGDFDITTAAIILTMLLISGILRFVQESKSQDSAAALLKMIQTTCTATRAGQEMTEIPMEELVAGDIIHLSVGDLVPADVRILEAKDLFLSQAGLTGESEPVEKTAEPISTQTITNTKASPAKKSTNPANLQISTNPETNSAEKKASLTDYPNLAFMGSSVISGTATAVAVNVGSHTMFGALASGLSQEAVETGFSKGVNSVSRLLIRFMAVMTPIVFFLNGITKGDWLSAFLFAVSIAVGLTPEMLPMIVTTCLAKGAVSMGKEKTVVKSLNAIQNFGSIDILCTDKTGTLTEDQVVLERHLNVNGEEDARVLRYAYLNSYFQTGYKNLMDLAVIRRTEEEEARNPQLVDLSENYKKRDEIPFDFTRRRLTTVVENSHGKTIMVTKGAAEEMLSICTSAEYNGTVKPLSDELRAKILSTISALSDRGFRVLVLARKCAPAPAGTFGVQDERDMTLIGYLAFLDPPKASAAKTIASLHRHGVETKVLTGDNEKVTRIICRQVGMKTEKILLGPELDLMDDEELRRAAETTNVFAKLTPQQKARVVTALRANGHSVGFLGDGINDAAAMKASDIGISVDTAVDVAKESADVILLEKDLTVLERGILEGRKTYANMIKYIKMTVSSNFGNMLSVLAASALLPFLPMTSLQLILLNLIYDLTCTAVPWDHVDAEFLEKPRQWDASSISRFMLWFGPVSSLFDIGTYLLLYFVICPAAAGGKVFTQLSDPAAQELFIRIFHAGWFLESMWSQTLVLHMLRTPKLSFIQSRTSRPLTVLSAIGILAATVLPFTPAAPALGFAVLPPVYFAWLALTVICYMLLTTAVKKLYMQKYGELL